MHKRTYRIEWMGIVTYVRASSRPGATRRIMRSAEEAGYWKRGQSLSGITCALVFEVPPDQTVLEGD